jgi:type II secretory pathway component GspD/PulD (secretin)
MPYSSRDLSGIPLISRPERSAGQPRVKGNEMHRSVLNWIIVLSLAVVVTEPTWLFGQGPGGGPGGRGRFGGGRRGMRDQIEQFLQKTAPAPNTAPDKPKEEKKDDKPAEPKKDEGPPPIIRPQAPDNSASLAEQKMVPDAKRLVSFNFQEAPWTFVVEELASVSGATLDWTTLPGDSLNLRSNQKYTAAEARDIINERLMARGYAILYDAKSSMMTVVNLDTMNTALVPRVAPEDLDTLSPHDLVKVSFRLDFLLAKDAVDEFKQVLSPKAKLLPLKTTNRLEAIDSVINLKQLYALLEEEQGRGSMSRLAQEFELRHTRAPEVVDQLELFLGLKKPGAPSTQASGDPMQQMMMQRMQMMQGQQGQQPGQQPQGTQAPPEVHLLANTRNNSVIVNAPPDKMGIIKAAIWKIDVPSNRELLTESTQMHRYTLATLDPEIAITFLESVGDLDPQTRIDVDKKNRTLIAYATPKDQKTIDAMVKNLDGADRMLKVIQLRRLDADLVAGTLRTLMPGAEDKNTNNNNSGGGFGRGRFGFFNPFASSTPTEETNTSKFRVEADVIDNRLMVWANTIELDQVYKCLSEMGEVTNRDRANDKVRVIDVGSGDDEQIMLERLRRLWPSIGKNGNKLIIEVPKKEHDKSPENPARDDSKPDQGVQKAPAVPSASTTNDKPRDTRTAQQSSSLMPAPLVHLADFKQSLATPEKALADNSTSSNKSGTAPSSADSPPPIHRHRGKGQMDRARQLPEQPAANAATAEKTDQPADKSGQGEPIYITRGADGKLVITSRDGEALNALEEIVGRIAPPKKDYAVYYLKHADSYAVKMNLDEFFETEKKDKSEDRMRRFWWDDSSNDKKDDTPKLSKRKPLRFIDDSQTNSILVQGGTPDQLRQIEELISMYDNPKPTTTRPSRVTQIFYVRHSKASVIAEVIKDTYRDLLSNKDKALESYNQTKAQGRGGQRGMISYDFGEHDDDGKMSQSRFNGALSMGVDDTTNTLVISCATQNMMLNVQQLVEKLDTAAVPAAQSFQVLQINRSIDANALQKKLMEMLKKPAAATTQTLEGGQGGPQQQQQQRRGGGGRGGQMHGGGENNGNE